MAGGPELLADEEQVSGGMVATWCDIMVTSRCLGRRRDGGRGGAVAAALRVAWRGVVWVRCRPGARWRERPVRLLAWPAPGTAPASAGAPSLALAARPPLRHTLPRAPCQHSAACRGRVPCCVS
jgi:hypothetical protein